MKSAGWIGTGVTLIALVFGVAFWQNPRKEVLEEGQIVNRFTEKQETTSALAEVATKTVEENNSESQIVSESIVQAEPNVSEPKAEVKVASKVSITKTEPAVSNEIPETKPVSVTTVVPVTKVNSEQKTAAIPVNEKKTVPASEKILNPVQKPAETKKTIVQPKLPTHQPAHPKLESPKPQTVQVASKEVKPVVKPEIAKPSAVASPKPAPLAADDDDDHSNISEELEKQSVTKQEDVQPFTDKSESDDQEDDHENDTHSDHDSSENASEASPAQSASEEEDESDDE